MRFDYRLYVSVGIGGMIGTLFRYSLSQFSLLKGSFPYDTLIANWMGCFLLSYLMFHDQIKGKLPPHINTALTVGVIGSFTTFSTFTVETITLWQSHLYLALAYILLSVLMGLVFCYSGYRLASRRKG